MRKLTLLICTVLLSSAAIAQENNSKIKTLTRSNSNFDLSKIRKRIESSGKSVGTKTNSKVIVITRENMTIAREDVLKRVSPPPPSNTIEITRNSPNAIPTKELKKRLGLR